MSSKINDLQKTVTVKKTETVHEGFSPKDLTESYSHLDRAKLQTWKKNPAVRAVLYPDRPVGTRRYKDGKKSNRTLVDRYSEWQLPFVAALNRCYQLGLNGDQTARAVLDRDVLRRLFPSKFTNAGLSMAKTLIGADESELPIRTTQETRLLLGCERTWLCEQSEQSEPPRLEYTLLACYPPDSSRRLPHDAPPFETLVSQTLAIGDYQTGKVVNFFGSKLESGFPLTASNRTITSALSLPMSLNENQDGPKFWMVAENKLNSNGTPDPACIFDAVDEATLELIGAYFTAYWRLTVIQRLGKTIQSLGDAPSLREMMKQVLITAAKTTGAYRGDVTLWEPEERLLRILELFGKGGTGYGGAGIDEVLQNPSICGWVAEQRLERYAQRTSEDPFYRIGNKRTKAEFAVPILGAQGNEVIGVLNLESEHEGGFGDQDLATARVCAQVASQFAQSVMARDTIVRSLLGSSSSTLAGLLRGIESEFGYPEGLVYLADYKAAKLRIQAPEDAPGCSPKYSKFSFGFRERSLASKVFMEGRHYYAMDAERDLFTSKRGVEVFNIKGPILGVPFRVGNLLVGTVVLWGKRDSSPPSTSFLEQIDRYIRNYVSGDIGQQREFAVTRIRTLRLALCFELSEPEVLRAILDSIIGVGFERARICQRVGKDKYRCLASIGVDDPDALKNVLIENCRDVVYDLPEGGRVFDARRFDPREVGSGPDPNAELLLKPKDLPYANVPLWHDNHLLGFIAGDNKGSRKKIHQLQLEALEIIAGLAAPSLAAVWTKFGRSH